MMEFAGRPLLWHMLDRVRRVRGIGDIVLATSSDPRNEPLRDFAASENIHFHQHDIEDDLAGRVAGAIKNLSGDVILKTGGDCPLIDPNVLQKMVDLALSEGDTDFVSNRVVWSYPLGLSADVLSRKAIEWADENLVEDIDRELFAVYIRDHPEQFKVLPIIHPVDLSHHVWTVDEPEDVPFMHDIFGHLYKDGECFYMDDVLAYLASKK
jgi:spore coat polysaccharide biosynthesis protein SpsF